MIISFSESIFNPYAYWGRRDIWPRGYPLKHVQVILVFQKQGQESESVIEYCNENI